MQDPMRREKETDARDDIGPNRLLEDGLTERKISRWRTTKNLLNGSGERKSIIFDSIPHRHLLVSRNTRISSEEYSVSSNEAG